MPVPGSDHSRYGGHTSSIGIADGDGAPNLIVDGGTGIHRLASLMGDEPFRGSILLGHLHWDHIYGLPFFSAGDRADSRVDVYMPDQEGRHGLGLTEMMAPPLFPISAAELRGDWTFRSLQEGCRVLEGYEVVAREIPHKGGRTLGFRISDGSSTIAYLSDHNPSALGEGPHGYGPYHDAAVLLAGEVDLLIHDAQYLEEEWQTHAHFGHSTPSYALGLAREANARRLLMFHHDPRRTDDELDRLAAVWSDIEGLEVIAAMEGQAIDVHRHD
jgi:ribonuclease BN (tRNA processing enzyme)